MNYLALFHTYFGLLSFMERVEAAGGHSRQVAAPRQLSISCATALEFGPHYSSTFIDEDTYAIYQIDNQKIEIVYLDPH